MKWFGQVLFQLLQEIHREQGQSNPFGPRRVAGQRAQVLDGVEGPAGAQQPGEHALLAEQGGAGELVIVRQAPQRQQLGRVRRVRRLV